MRSSELFDILGEIDDKYFEEAKQPDVQHGELIVAESNPFRSFMSIFAPIAACAAVIVAVVIGANFVSKNAGLVGPNDSDSSSDVTLSSDSSTVSETESSVSSTESSSDSSAPVVDDNKIRLEDYPPIDLDTVPDLKGSGLETQMSQQDKLLQKATLATLKCGEYELYMLGEDIHIDKSNDPLCLYSYDMVLAVVKDGEVISSDGPHTFSVSNHQGGYVLAADDLANYVEYYEMDEANLIIFKYHEPGWSNYECSFFSIIDGKLVFLMGDQSELNYDGLQSNAYLSDGYSVFGNHHSNCIIDGNTVYRFRPFSFDQNPYDHFPHYTAKAFNLSEYPWFDKSVLLDEADITDEKEQCIPKTKLFEKQVGEYTLTLIGEYVRTDKEHTSDDIIIASDYYKVISHNGKILSYINTAVQCEYKIDWFEGSIPDAYELNNGIVVNLSTYEDEDERFLMIKGDYAVEGTGDFSAIRDIDPPAEYDEHNYERIVLSEENALICHSALKYTFDFNTYTFTAKYTNAEPLILDEYTPYDKTSTDYQSKTILEEKEAGGYKFYLLGQNAKNSLDNYDEMRGTTFSVCSFTKLIVAVEKDGRLIANTDVYTPNTGHDVEMIGQLLRPFEMKDGIGFVMYVNLQSSGTNTYAMIYQIKNDTITNIKYEYDFAPQTPMGTPWAMAESFEVDYENNAIVYKAYNDDDKKITLTIDFSNNLSSMSEE